MTRLDASQTISEFVGSPIETGAAGDSVLSSGELHQNRMAWEKVIGTPVINVSFTRGMFVPEQYERLLSLIRTFFRRGGMQMQFTIVDRATLMDAMAHPEQHSGLMVRVAGYSARFVDLGREGQQEIVERTIH